MTGHVLTRTGQSAGDQGRGRWVQWAVWAAVWLPGLLVALGAGVATAHGLYEVAAAAGAPEPIAWLYPLITDGLALVAYASTARLTGRGRGYAWGVVVLAAGLSGLAQASYLTGGVASAPAPLRFGVGAWPAIAAAIVAHLLFLLGTDARPDAQGHQLLTAPAVHPPAKEDVQPGAVDNPVQSGVQPRPLNGAVHLDGTPVGHEPVEQPPAVYTGTPVTGSAPESVGQLVEQSSAGRAGSPVRERARSAARRHAARHGALPTVSELAGLAKVARGTAATVLRELRAQPAQLHAVPNTDDARSTP
jgi:hypothetical protein